MGATGARLFSGGPLGVYLDNKRKELRASVEQLESADECSPESRKRLVAEVVVEPLALARERAKFTTGAARNNTVHASISVPFKGDRALFKRSVEGAADARHLMGDVYDGTWGDKTPELVFGRDFSENAIPDDVRAWAKSMVDATEALISIQRSAIERHNQELEVLAVTLIDQRRALLQTRDSLANGLSDGI